MNAFKFQQTSIIKEKDFYTQFTYPIGVKVVSFKTGAEIAPKQCRAEVLLDLVDHFVIEERNQKVKPTIQTFVEDMKGIQNSRQWFHDRKEKKTDLVLEKLKEGLLPKMENVVKEYELIEGSENKLMLIYCVFKDTLENK